MELTVGPTVDIMRYCWRLIEKNCERNYAIAKGRFTWNTMDKFKNNLEGHHVWLSVARTGEARGLSPPKKELSPPNKCVSSQIDVDEVVNIFAKMHSLRVREIHQDGSLEKSYARRIFYVGLK
jgi:hypothetical protein